MRHPRHVMQGTPVVLTDEALLARVGEGDEAAFAEFYDRYAGRVFGLLHRMTGARSEAEDLLQKTFLQIWRQASTYDSARSSPSVWVILLARSRAADQLRRRREFAGPCPSAESAMHEPSAELERRETALLAQTALARLPEEQQAAIRLAFFRGMTHEQIAASQSIPLGTVKTRIRRGMQRMREVLNGRAAP